MPMKDGIMHFDSEAERKAVAALGPAELSDLSELAAKYPKGEGGAVGDLVRLAAGARKSVRRHLADFHNAAEAVGRDAKLTDVGKRDARARLGREYAGKVPVGDNFIRKMREQLDALDAKLSGSGSLDPKASEDRLADAMERAEVRRLLMDRPDHERIQIFLDAAEQGEDVVVKAVLDAPGFLKMVDGESLRIGRESWHRTRNPEAARHRADLAEALESVTDARDRVTRTIERDSGLPSESQLREERIWQGDEGAVREHIAAQDAGAA